MTRTIAQIRCCAYALLAAGLLAGCTVATVSPYVAPVAEATSTVTPTLAPSATPTAAPLVEVVQPPPTATLPTSATPTQPPPTSTTAPPTATSTATLTPAPSRTAAPAAATPKPSATKQPTPASAATKQPTATAITVKAPSGKVVGLDPGHHYKDPGGTSIAGLPEYKLNMEVALNVRAILVARGYAVRLSRTTTSPVSCWCASTYTAKVQAEQEARIAAVGAVRAYVPIHFNASPSHELKGTEAYYNASTATGAQSRSLAQSLVSNVVSSLSAAGYTPVNRGAKSDLLAGKSYGHMFSLRGPYTAALMESLFMDQPDDAAAIKDPKKRYAVAQGIANGIIAFVR